MRAPAGHVPLAARTVVVVAATTTAVVLSTSGVLPIAGGRAESARADTQAAIVVRAMEPAEFRPDQPVTLRGVVSAGDSPVADAALVLSRTRDRLDDRAAVVAWEQPQPDPPVVRLADVPLGTVTSGASVPFEVVLAPAALRLRATLGDAGPYGLVVRLVDGATGEPVAERRGFAVWSPAVAEPSRLLPVLSLPGLPTDPATGLVDPDDLETATARDGVLRTALDAAAALPGAWAVDPTVVESGRAQEVGPSTALWVQDLARAARDREVLVQPWGRPSQDFLAGSGRVADVWALLDTVTAPVMSGEVQQVTADPGAGLGGGARADVTVLADPVSVEGLAAAGYGGRSVVLPEAAAPPGDPQSPYTPGARADLATPVGPVRAVVADAALSARFTAATTGDALIVTALLGDLAALTLERPYDPRTVAVLANGLETANSGGVAVLAQAIGGSAWVRTVDLPAALGSAPSPQPRAAPPPLDPAVAAEASPATGALLDALDTLRSLEDAVPEGPIGGLAHQRPAASSVADGADAVTRVADALAVEAATWVQGVRIVPGSSITLAATQAVLPVTIVNDLDHDVALTLQARSRSPRVRVPDPAVAVDIPAGGRQRIDLPVRAVSSGQATLSLRLLTPDTTPWGPAVDVDVRVSRAAEAGALAVVAVLIAGVFAVGVWRTIRRGRRRRGARIAT